MLLAIEHPQEVNDYLAHEKSLEKVGSIPKYLLSTISLQISSFGIILNKMKVESSYLLLISPLQVGE